MCDGGDGEVTEGRAKSWRANPKTDDLSSSEGGERKTPFFSLLQFAANATTTISALDADLQRSSCLKIPNPTLETFSIKVR
ncbi:hypothetical protein ACHAXS_013195 [Conticribra weissflogii]